MIRRCFALALTCCSIAAVACSAGAPEEEDIGRASAAITQVPAQVGCIEIDVTGARSVTQRYDVSAGQSSVLSLTGLPLGLDTFVGLAYPGVCSAVASAAQATWISDAVQASLVAQQVASVTLVLRPNGESSVGVSFQGDDGGSDAQTVACAVPQTMCGGTCTSTATDPANCGACGAVCSAINGATACVAGSCRIATCAAGFADCDGLAADGCETNVGSSVSSCGACGHACAAANGISSCVSGVCGIAQCTAGFADCDHIAANGCETNTTTSASNCGTCGHTCTLLCSNSVCL
jgi:hypothetical protein